LQFSKSSLIGVVIAGGQSHRMGAQDKLWLELGGQSLLMRAASRLKDQTGQIILNINGDVDVPIGLAEAIVPDEMDQGEGPLSGMLSVMKWIAQNAPDITHIITAPTDAPFFPIDMVEKMLNSAQYDDITVPFYDGYPQPLFGLWPVKCVTSLDIFLANPDNRKVMTFVRSQKWTRLDIKNQTPDPFMNINTQDDWEMVQQCFDKGDYV
jgi:molybdopterin-guanine dinucleotide biosynthesis protein A